MPAFCLEMHAGYLCRHQGACCTAGWAIPVEATAARAIRLHFAGEERTRWLGSDGPLPGGAAGILPMRAAGACAFFDDAHGRLCDIHRELGPSALPSVCRHFPRVVLSDPRGTFVSLSHFCPTAAALLFEASSTRIVLAPDTLSLAGTAEGLDARSVLPPLLRPGMLTDHAGYGLWERRCLEILSNGRTSADESLAAIGAASDCVQSWSPGPESLSERIERLFDSATTAAPISTHHRDLRDFALALASIPEGLARPSVPDIDAVTIDTSRVWRDHDAPIRRYLAARLFGNWYAYQVHSLGAVVRAIEVHAAVLRVEIARRLVEGSEDEQRLVLEAIRAADLLMVHLSDSLALSALIERAL